MFKLIVLSTLTVIVCLTFVNSTTLTKFDIIDIHDNRNDQEFYNFVDEQLTVAMNRGNERLLEFYNWIKAARLECESKLENWPTFPRSREVLRLKMREKWLKLKDYEIVARRQLIKRN